MEINRVSMKILIRSGVYLWYYKMAKGEGFDPYPLSLCPQVIFVPIAPGSYVMTSITCKYGRGATWIGSDKPNLFAAESGFAMQPVKGDNVIDVKPGEILDAGIVEIRSDHVGFFEARTASVVASGAPANDEAQLR